MTSEEKIEKAVEAVSQNIDQKILHFVENASFISKYLLSDEFKLLTVDEKETMLFIHLVIWECIDNKNGDFDIEGFQETEEKNWTTLESIKGNWEQKTNVLFENYKEEELLAFAEDMVNDETISKVSRELIFVTAKSFIDYCF